MSLDRVRLRSRRLVAGEKYELVPLLIYCRRSIFSPAAASVAATTTSVATPLKSDRRVKIVNRWERKMPVSSERKETNETGQM